MPRLFSGSDLVIATHNPGKLEEFRELLAPFGVRVSSAGERGLPEPEETGATFHENAAIKALAAARAAQLPALADDSGLCVTALGGRPGLHTARWCGPQKDPVQAMRRVQDELGAAADRSAYFICVLALAWPDGHVETVEGRCNGQIVWPMRGAGGHGYDPCFVPDGDTRTFAEMPLADKHGYSHRGKAIDALKALFQKSA